MMNNRGIKWTMLILAIVMVFGLFSLTAMAEQDESVEGTTSTDVNVVNEVLLNSGYAEEPVFRDGDGKEVTLSPEVDPEKPLYMDLSISAADGKALPASTETVTVSYQLPEGLTAVPGSNENGISWTVSEEDSRILVFSWNKDAVNSFSARITVIPAYPDTLELGGKSFAIVVKKSVVLLSSEDGSIVAVDATTDSVGKLWYERPENTYWTFEHISGNWYKISSEGKYLNISTGGLKLTGAEEAQTIKVDNKGSYYVLQAEGYTLSCNKTTEGFKTVNTGKATDQQYQVYLHSEISNESSNGLGSGGQYIIANSKQKYHNLMLDESGLINTNSLAAAQFTLDGDTVIPSGKYVMWQFEQMARNWYYISNGKGQYLKVVSNGVLLTSERTPTLVMRDGANNKYSFTSLGLTNVWMNNKSDRTDIGFWYTTNKDYKWLQLFSSVKVPTTTIPSGEWLITYSGNNSVMLTGKKDSGLASSIFQMENSNDYPLWSFERVEGNYYYVKSGNQYLHVEKAGVSLSGTPQMLYIRQEGDQYLITDGKAYELNKKKDNATSGFQSIYDHDSKTGSTWITLVKPSGVYRVSFSVNGGNTAMGSTFIEAQPGESIVLPDYSGTKGDTRFIGWAKVSDIYVNIRGTNHSYYDVFLPGSEIIVNENMTLYAVYNEQGTDARFGIRLDGTIPDEPGNYNQSGYGGHVSISDAIIDGKWVVDTNGNKPIEGNHIVNNVTANLTKLPSDEQIRNALKKEGGKDYDPETMYVHWYVMKYSGGQWKIDGVLRLREKRSISYNTNVEDRQDNTSVANMPLGYETTRSSIVTVGAGQDGTIKTPAREGYIFTGWNSEPDGSGTAFITGSTIQLTGNVNLYAQWTKENVRSITITSDWPDGKQGYRGARITMTATLYGFEDVTSYTLQWQYSTDGDTWHDVANAHGITYTYELDETTRYNTWRVIAVDIR